MKLASDYAFANADEKLQARVHEYEQKTQESLSNEALAVSNFLLVIMIALISFQTGAPNFLMKVSNFADPLVSGNAYKIVLGFLFLQGVLGRVSSFYLLHAAGHLPPNFFRDENERKKVANWTSELIDRYKPLAREWMDKG
ncbi:hypothetical protein GCM10011341_32620 [Frigidibacter albus]|nr:hypothetical protein GCM10011341_32620 [Frigidibacter albus]